MTWSSASRPVTVSPVSMAVLPLRFSRIGQSLLSAKAARFTVTLHSFVFPSTGAKLMASMAPLTLNWESAGASGAWMI